MTRKTKLISFENQKYLNLETFRRSGDGVPTPVWFVADGEKLYVRTTANSGKVKRVRSNGRAQVAPCDMRGKLSGDWVPARARVLGKDEVEQVKAVNRMLKRKYGLLKIAFDLASRLQKHRTDTIEIELIE
ncbi:MAG TPA: PPOX class F420-dependent oxidoreductase [Levilinea sp.]|nr:PPOX class F420-dependent oxidoreductase [Levilinea sp.]